MADRNFEALDEALKRPAPAAPELTAPTVENLDDDSVDDANWAYLDGDPFINHEEELAAVADAVSAAPRVLDALRSVLDGKLQHCTYPNGTMAIATEDESHLGLELNSSPDAVTELTVHRGFCGEFDIVFFGRQPRTTLVAFSAVRTRADIAVGLRGRRLLSRDVSWCNADVQNTCPTHSESPALSSSQNACRCKAGYYGDGSKTGTSPCSVDKALRMAARTSSASSSLCR
jgi:hypothetical protein